MADTRRAGLQRWPRRRGLLKLPRPHNAPRLPKNVPADQVALAALPPPWFDSYLEFSQVAARCVRNALKEAPKKEAAVRGEVDLMYRTWDKGTPAAVRT